MTSFNVSSDFSILVELWTLSFLVRTTSDLIPLLLRYKQHVDIEKKLLEWLLGSFSCRVVFFAHSFLLSRSSFDL